MSCWNPSRLWHRFLFEPVDPSAISLLRIGVGLLMLAQCVLLTPSLLDFYGDHATLRLEDALAWSTRGRLDLFVLFESQDLAARLLLTAMVLTSLCLTVGLCSRLSSALTFVLLVSFVHRNPAIFNAATTTLRCMLFLLTLSHGGKAFSVDALLRRRGWLRWAGLSPLPADAKFPPWAQRMIQLQICVIYFVTFVWKLKGSHWRDGTALYYVSRLLAYKRFAVPYIFEHMWTIKLLTWGTLVIEALLGTLVWVPRLRYPILVGGILLHLGIEYTMNVPLFSWCMIFPYITFVEPQHLEKWLEGAARGWSRLTRRSAREAISPQPNPLLPGD